MPFPTNLLTTADSTQATGLRVDLPPPELRGRRPTAPTSTSSTRSMASTAAADHGAVHRRHRRRHGQQRHHLPRPATSWRRACGRHQPDHLGPAAKTLVFESDELLAGYALPAGRHRRRARRRRQARSSGTAFRHDLRFGQNKDAHADYRGNCATRATRPARTQKIVAASLFTTQSVSTDLAKIRRQIKQSPRRRWTSTSARRASARCSRAAAVPGSSASGRRALRRPSPLFLPTPALKVVPGAVGTDRLRPFRSPDYETAAKVIPATGNDDRRTGAARHERAVFECSCRRHRSLPAAGR